MDSTGGVFVVNLPRRIAGRSLTDLLLASTLVIGVVLPLLWEISIHTEKRRDLRFRSFWHLELDRLRTEIEFDARTGIPTASLPQRGLTVERGHSAASRGSPPEVKLQWYAREEVDWIALEIGDPHRFEVCWIARPAPVVLEGGSKP